MSQSLFGLVLELERRSPIMPTASFKNGSSSSTHWNSQKGGGLGGGGLDGGGPNGAGLDGGRPKPRRRSLNTLNRHSEKALHAKN